MLFTLDAKIPTSELAYIAQILLLEQLTNITIKTSIYNSNNSQIIKSINLHGLYNLSTRVIIKPNLTYGYFYAQSKQVFHNIYRLNRCRFLDH